MTPQFLRSEAARFRQMAESLTDREASRQRLLAMAVGYDKRAEQAEQYQPHEQMQAAKPEAAPDDAIEPEPGGTGRGTSTKFRLSRATGGSSPCKLRRRGHAAPRQLGPIDIVETTSRSETASHAAGRHSRAGRHPRLT